MTGVLISYRGQASIVSVLCLIPARAHALHRFYASPLSPAFGDIYVGCLKWTIMGEFMSKYLANTTNQGYFLLSGGPIVRHLSAHH